MTTSDAYALGIQNRAAVLGQEHVERSLRDASDFARPLQDLVTEYCWGAVWGRPGLEFTTRSLLNIATLAALNRQHELAVHVRGALNNGCTVDQIRETLIQTAVYVGVPAALEATRTAEAAITNFVAIAGSTAASGTTTAAGQTAASDETAA